MARSRTLSFFILKGRCDKTLKTSVVEAEKRMNRVSIDSEIFELPLSSFVLEPDYANIAKEVATYITTSFIRNPLVGRLAHISFCKPHGCDSCLFDPQWIPFLIFIYHNSSSLTDQPTGRIVQQLLCQTSMRLRARWFLRVLPSGRFQHLHGNQYAVIMR